MEQSAAFWRAHNNEAYCYAGIQQGNQQLNASYTTYLNIMPQNDWTYYRKWIAYL